jgi:hypothetical protein
MQLLVDSHQSRNGQLQTSVTLALRLEPVDILRKKDEVRPLVGLLP